MASRITTIFPFLLITLGCIVGVELFYFGIEQLVFKEKNEQQIPAPKSQIAQPESDGERPPAPVDYNIITARNLFGPPPGKKQEQSASLKPAEDLEATSLDLVLMGTIFTKSDEARAVILTKKDRKQDIYRVGDQIQGALVKEIRRGSIVLTVDGQDESLDMSEANKYGTRTPAGPVAANLPRRVPAVIPGQDAESDSETVERVRPRIVRPSRRIISSRRQRVAVEPEAVTDETDKVNDESGETEETELEEVEQDSVEEVEPQENVETQETVEQ